MLEYHIVCNVWTALRVGRSGVRIPVEAKPFTILLNIQTICAAHHLHWVQDLFSGT